MNTYQKPTWLTPYNTGKVQIGALYTPKFQPHPMTIDGLRLQRALLKKPTTDTSSLRRLSKLLSLVRGLTTRGVK